jgi:hypothetical protein
MANGGYVCGHVASHVGPCAEMGLKRPTPLDKPLKILKEDDVVRLFDGDDILLEGRPATLEVEVPIPPSFNLAIEASKGFRGHMELGDFNNCYVCGSNRKDGMRIFTGPVPGDDMGLQAGPWVADERYVDDEDIVKVEFLHAALDCPGFYATAAEKELALLGKFTTKIVGKISLGEKCIIIGWPISRSGRKLLAGTAIFNEEGAMVASAQAVWIVINSIP